MSSTIPIPGVNQLTQTFYTQIVEATLASERAPITRLESQRTVLNRLVDAYNALNTRVTDLTTAMDALRASSASTWGAKTVTVGSRSLAEGIILTASAGSTAIEGTYDIAITSLARAQRAASDEQASSTIALGLEGTFVIGGGATRSVSAAVTVANTVSAFGTAAVRDGQAELGHDTYHVEIRDSGNTLQFRLVDGYGNAVSVDDAADAGSGMTSDWQNLDLVAGTTFDTARGLTIAFDPLADHVVANAVTVADTVDGFSTSAVQAGKSELGSGAYYVEVRENGTGSGDWEFRLVDGSGNAVSVYDATADDGRFTAEWQGLDAVLANADDGVYSTGRGLSIDFGSGAYTAGSKDSGAAQVDYAARLNQVGLRGAGAANVTYGAAGALVTVTSDDTLSDIASAINGASYPSGAGVSASVVNNRLVVTSKSTGLAHAIQLADVTGTVLGGTGSAGLGLITAANTFKNTTADTGYQAPSDAVFSVNGMQVTRDRNTGLSGIISGITLDLAADAEGQSATLTVSPNVDTVKTKITAFLDALNALQSHIRSQTAVTSFGSGESAVYSRSALSGDNSILTALRNSLFTTFYSNVSGLPAGAPSNLRQIGITLDMTLTAHIADASALDAALAGDPEGVEALFDGLMTKLGDMLSPFDGTDGIVNGKITATSGQIRNIDDRIRRIEERLEDRRVVLEKQFAYLQVQLTQMSYTQQRLMSYWDGGSYG